ncbi:hypothetical protein [Streptomyces alkaliterrae]|uniref:DUF2178 domain-containing protein n=2 Tax=Streptomyces alkaliterrae TaxID=2213162 RepID=A0A5P0YSJ9_9ACTN|nr:hypothetical protein [Streptomyces alkaliterrae]MBB1254490.1 hypothetical protein [Streptomyces alkaliterrae]MBB1260355.1 hypothetical protein [Streptomyces alkaliterrae]MQS03301.1 hypothetical protein [Streptomyces alkaliterrae]
MAFEEKRTWVFALVTLAGYLVYLAVVLGRAGSGPVDEAPYVAAMLWTIAAMVVVTVLAYLVIVAASGGERELTDQRDREIERFGTHVGQGMLVLGAVGALVLAMLEVAHFWIANALFLGFVLTSLLESVAKLVAYRRGFQPW